MNLENGRKKDMAISTSCCLNLTPPHNSAPSTLSPAKGNTQTAWFRNENWRSKFVVTMACMVIGVEVGDLVREDSQAVAKDMELSIMESERKGLRWSDKRICPPWHLNSLETIVPENLPRPRPSARRRWEAVGHSNKQAPKVEFKVTVKSINDCFSM